MALVVKNPPDDAGDTGVSGLIPALGRPPGGGNGNPLQYSCLENSMDRGAQWAAVSGTAESRTRLSENAHVVLLDHDFTISSEASAFC